MFTARHKPSETSNVLMYLDHMFQVVGIPTGLGAVSTTQIVK